MSNEIKLKNDLLTDKYTEVYYEEGKNNAGTPTYFGVINKDKQVLAKIAFQDGAIKEYGVNGVANEDVISMVIARLEHWQTTEFKCRENACAITKLEEALMWLRKRTVSRENRGVEGTHKI